MEFLDVTGALVAIDRIIAIQVVEEDLYIWLQECQEPLVIENGAEQLDKIRGQLVRTPS